VHFAELTAALEIVSIAESENSGRRQGGGKRELWQFAAKSSAGWNTISPRSVPGTLNGAISVRARIIVPGLRLLRLLFQAPQKDCDLLLRHLSRKGEHPSRHPAA
jgi:hypothetical protein